MRAKKAPPPKPGNLISGQDEENIHSPHRKTVRRRAQARKPYQEKLMNMAEARREIVMALKLHRASMKRAEQQPVSHHHSSAEQEAILKSRRNPRIIYASTNYYYYYYYYYYVNNNIINAYSPGLYSRPVSSSAPPLFIQENPNFVLPTQTLGLKLNLQNFNGLDASFYSSANSSSIYNSSSSIPSTSCSPEVTYVAGSPAVDDRRWGDDLNLDGRAKFLEPMGGMGPELGVSSSPFDEVMELPAWLSADECCVVGGDYFRDPDLPCMDIEEIEGMDEDWLA